MSQQAVIISCPECGTKFKFELSDKHIKRPNKRLKMRCYVCAHQFGVKPKELLGPSSNPVESFIRVQSAFGLKNYRSWDELRLQFGQVEFRNSDPARRASRRYDLKLAACAGREFQAGIASLYAQRAASETRMAGASIRENRIIGVTSASVRKVF